MISGLLAHSEERFPVKKMVPGAKPGQPSYKTLTHFGPIEYRSSIPLRRSRIKLKP